MYPFGNYKEQTSAKTQFLFLHFNHDRANVPRGCIATGYSRSPSQHSLRLHSDRILVLISHTDHAKVPRGFIATGSRADQVYTLMPGRSILFVFSISMPCSQASSQGRRSIKIEEKPKMNATQRTSGAVMHDASEPLWGLEFHRSWVLTQQSSIRSPRDRGIGASLIKLGGT